VFAVDEIAYASPAKNWPPLGKLLLALSLLLVSLISSSLPIPLLVLTVGTVLLYYSTRFRFPRAIVLALIDAALVLALGAVIVALLTAGTPLLSWNVAGVQITITREGWEAAIFIFLRAMAGVTVMLFFATSTPIPHFAHALRQLRMPVEIAELFILIYRYSFLLLEQLESMHVAASCRLGFRGARNKVRTTSRLAVGLFLRSLDMAERSQAALNCRSYQGYFPSYRPPAKLTAAWVAAPLLAFLTLFLLNILIERSALGW